MNKYWVFIVMAFSLMNCRSTSVLYPDNSSNLIEEERFLDTLYVFPESTEEKSLKKTYQSTPQRIIDLIHFDLFIDLDWDNKFVLGKAILTLTPFFDSVDTIILDAKNFDFHEVIIYPEVKVNFYVYDSSIIKIPLSSPKIALDTFKIELNYTAKPNTSNQGLFFIEADTLKNKSKQIWTQGETSWNSRWFPTVDHPNERATHDIFITVDDNMKTLSNGVLVNSFTLGNGKKTDHWSMSMPHAPYLTALIAGDFSVYKESWNGIPLSYYVDPPFEKDAKYIFNHTPEMLSFFSEILEFPFPWPSYAQIVVRDYISGAMENTTAVTFGEFVQKITGDLIGNTNDNIVAHEMIHHWFGDLVTCESWSNLALNEGFANYGEFLWLEHKYGKDKAYEHLLNERRGYFQESSYKKRAIIDYFYEDAEDMFDAHSYNKAGAVLHMLRKYLGDRAFFKSLNYYLHRHSFEAVEIHDLRIAFETVSGKDLNWFFNQWFLTPGHPQIEYSYSFDESKSLLSLEFNQTQSPDFILPLNIDFILKDSLITHSILLDSKNQSFEFSISENPIAIIPDPSGDLLVEFKSELSPESNLAIVIRSQEIIPQIISFEKLLSNGMDAFTEEAIHFIFKENKSPLLKIVLDEIAEEDIPSFEKQIKELAFTHSNPVIRSKAWENLAIAKLPGHEMMAEKSIQSDSSNLVIGAALTYLFKFDSAKGTIISKGLQNKNSDILNSILGNIYAESGNIEFLEFFEKNLHGIADYESPNFFSGYAQLSILSGVSPIQHCINELKKFALNPHVSIWKRFAATQALVFMRNSLNDQVEFLNILNQTINEIIQNEKEERLLFIYKQF